MVQRKKKRKQPRYTVITVRMNDEQHTQIKQAAKLAGLSANRFSLLSMLAAAHQAAEQAAANSEEE